jgi:hypothetical protein
MTTVVLVGVASFLVVLAIIVKARAAKPKKPEKWEKAQIVKRLLALSEREDIVNGISRQQPVSQSPTLATAWRRAPLHLVRCDQLDIDGIHETALNGRYETILLTRAAILWGSCSPDVLSRV